MQTSKELSSFTVVNSKRRYQPDENPLFNYLIDEYKNKKRSTNNPGFTRIGECEQDGRHALFFHQTFTEIDFPVFEKFSLTDLHLSVDHILLNTTTTPARKLPPYHISLVYTNKIGENINVRIEFVKHQTEIYAKHYFPDDSITHLTLSSLQKEYLLLQASSAQQLLQAFVQHNQLAQYQLLSEVERLEKLLIENSSPKEETLQKIIECLTQYVRYRGYWDSRIDRYQEQLEHLKIAQSIETNRIEENVPCSEELKLTQPSRSTVTKSHTSSNKKQITDYISLWLAESPVDAKDNMEIIAWIKTHFEKFITLNDLCLDYFWHTPAKQSQPFIQAQYQRLPTRGTLIEFFKHHLFLGEHELVREIVPLLYDTTELYQIYIQFLQAIEQETHLRTQRIVTAHVLYEICPFYKNALLYKKYNLRHDNENLNGILFDLFIQDQFEVFSMYVDQNIASDTGLQLLMQGKPYHAVGAITSFLYDKPHAAAYLEKLFSRHCYNGLPHIENLDLSLYQINGKNIERKSANTYLITSQGKKITFNVLEMRPYSSMTMLRHSLKIYTHCFRLNLETRKLQHAPALFRLLTRHTTPEIVIRETMTFFEHSFFTTIYSSPSLAGVHPHILMQNSMESFSTSLETFDLTEGESVRVIFGLILDSPNQRHWGDLTFNIAQDLLSQCLSVFNSCTIEEQTRIIRNLNQLSLTAIRKQEVNESLALTRALIFCCLSAQNPTIEFHDTLLRAIFMFCNMSSLIQEHLSGPYLKDMAKNYVKGLSETERVQLMNKNPALIRRIMGETYSPTMFASSTLAHVTSRDSTPADIAPKTQNSMRA